MTFLKNKFFKSLNKTDVSGQEISSTYVEIQGSRVEIEKLNTSSDLYYFLALVFPFVLLLLLIKVFFMLSFKKVMMIFLLI